MRERHNSLRQRGLEKRSLRQWHSRPSDKQKNRKIYTRSASLPTSQKTHKELLDGRGASVSQRGRGRVRESTADWQQSLAKEVKSENVTRDDAKNKKKQGDLVLFRERREYTGRKRPNKREEVAPVSLGTLKGESLMHSHSESSATASLFLMLRSVLFQDFWSASLCINTISF